ncbi:hypothetical protein A7U60_g1755 [Sanghuangporus baumii]|uniref:Uncharacterized protein n=1 Tax=Sanghuangporus baumii TaxID=108892 RepID=A0A9Q5NB20_SANBA|nr:hypothetical protein A7U60_g1755 [Sanghuangporus baumii]
MGRDKRGMLVDILDTWLSRTNGSPISYMFLCSLGEKDDVEDHRRAEYMIKTLLSQQYRWKDVNFAWFNVNCSDEFPGLHMTNMPMVTSLFFYVNLKTHAAISLAQSSRLKSLDVRGSFDLSIVGEPLCMLNRCDFVFLSAFGFTGDRALRISLDVLKNAPFLTRFEAYFSPNLALSSRHDPHPRLLLRSLRTLKLEHGEAAAAIVDNVTLPSLEAFYYGSRVTEGIVFNFFQRSRPSLTFLAICGPCVGEDEIFGILRLLPCLKALRYSFSVVSKRFFSELAVGIAEIEENALSVEQAICPKLEILRLQNLLPLDSINECVEALITMMRSRARIQKSFENIRLELGNANSVEINVSDIGNYTEALAQCFEDRKGYLVVGDYENAFRKSFPPKSD